MILIINGPNLNRLGRRDKNIYGVCTLADIEASLRRRLPDADLCFFQSNAEGDIIDCIQQADDNSDCKGIVINPGAYAHYSFAIADAIRDCSKPIVEVHISNIHSREEWRARSVTADAALGVITGLGSEGYYLAASYLLNLPSNED